MRKYLIETTTGARWEIVGGIYIVKAESKAEAKEKIINYFKRRIRYKPETIESVKLLSDRVEVLEVQTPFEE